MSESEPSSPVPVNAAADSGAPAADAESALRESLKRCSPATLEAALAFRATKDPKHLSEVVIGVVERFVEPDLRPKLKEAGVTELRMVDDLGIDSLTMMEIVILMEEVVQMQIDNEELRHLRTVGDINVFIDCKVRGLPLPKPPKRMAIEEIVAAMPIQPPFLFINEATLTATGAQGVYKISGQEFFLQGHFKDNPVMPASMMLEALGQLAVLYLLEGATPEAGKVMDAKSIFFTSCEGVRCHRVCKPGDVLSLAIKPKRSKEPLATFEGSIRVGQEKAAVAEEITLTFAWADAPAASEPATAVAADVTEVSVNGAAPTA